MANSQMEGKTYADQKILEVFLGMLLPMKI